MVPALGLPVQKLAMARILVKQEVMNVDESQQDLYNCVFFCINAMRPGAALQQRSLRHHQ